MTHILQNEGLFHDTCARPQKLRTAQQTNHLTANTIILCYWAYLILPSLPHRLVAPYGYGPGAMRRSASFDGLGGIRGQRGNNPGGIGDFNGDYSLQRLVRASPSKRRPKGSSKTNEMRFVLRKVSKVIS